MTVLSRTINRRFGEGINKGLDAMKKKQEENKAKIMEIAKNHLRKRR